MKAKPWTFTLKIVARYKRSNTKNAVHLCYHPLAKVVATSRQTPDTHGEPLLHCLHCNQYPLCHYQPPIAGNMTFSTSTSFREIYIKTSPMPSTRQRSFAPRPNDSTLVEDKGMHDRTDSIHIQ